MKKQTSDGFREYLVHLRKTQGYRQEDVYIQACKILGRDPTNRPSRNVARYEVGDLVPPADILAAILTVLNGNADHARELLIDRDAPAERGRELAQQALWVVRGY
jgi:hypothetical protein